MQEGEGSQSLSFPSPPPSPELRRATLELPPSSGPCLSDSPLLTMAQSPSSSSSSTAAAAASGCRRRTARGECMRFEEHRWSWLVGLYCGTVLCCVALQPPPVVLWVLLNAVGFSYVAA